MHAHTSRADGHDVQGHGCQFGSCSRIWTADAAGFKVSIRFLPLRKLVAHAFGFVYVPSS